ncbi:MAG TPA: glycosyltransferase family 2 protein [Patescibacteria group bacterium]|nr:glycosyltransferase family 2 protein [Patescibacteria group bacterium]
MNNFKPLISILIPVHNSEKYLADCLKSLVSQSYRNIEIVAIEDKSTDSSYQILKKFNKNYKKIRAYRNVKRYGIVMTLNRLIKKAKGEYVAFMDSDDLSHKDRIKNQLEFLLNNPNVVAVGTQSHFINGKGVKKSKSLFPLENRDIYKSPLHGLSMQFETVMVNRNLLPKDLLRFDHKANPFIYSDFLIKLLPYGKFANLPEFLHYHRNNPKTYLLDLQRNIFSFAKLVLRSRELHDYQKAYRLFFTSLVKPSIDTNF